MSLECEGRGAVCEECGHFDFLPTRCSYCRGLFCATHATRHHVAVLEPSPAGGATGPWCAPPTEASQGVSCTLGPSDLKQSDLRPFDLSLSDLRPSDLRPCAEHGHEEAPSGREGGKRVRGAQVAGRAPLVLVPPDYTGRRMGLVAVVALPRPGASMGWNLDVCSLSVATEFALGQLVERCLGALKLSNRSSDVTPGDFSRATLWRIVAHFDKVAKGGMTRADQATFTGQTPTLRLDPQSLAVVARETLSSGDTVVLLATNSPNDSKKDWTISSLSEALVDLFFSPHRRSGELANNPFVLAAATRLRLQAQARLSTSPLGVDLDRKCTTLMSEQGGAHEQEDHLDNAVSAVKANCPLDNYSILAVSHPSAGPSPVISTDDAALSPSEWPFRTPPPFSKFSFSNNKVNPRGAKEASGSGNTRVVAAVFVEDLSLPAAVMPFCIALRQQWCTGKLIERVKEEAAASSGLRLGAFSEYHVFILTSDPPKKLNKEDRSVPIANGDVLLLGKSEYCEDDVATRTGVTVNRAVVQELDCMRQLKGKEQMALRMDMMKKCILM
ncbi:unnamed protein product [Phytomonas sp. Hart1]|nr:unnamed protein product [Phytomonas sp. Hart1]|eukprot:CCW70883.1 unnamed protein product [Phytomonas sp. isolate Hart1]